jgi:predicted DCC family thiol-disulfide oxidoreductase YuxK
MITVFYDGKCGLCSKEINHYRKIAPVGIFYWQDITESTDDLKKEGISLSKGLKLLHAKDEEGLMHVGVDAFILIWKQLKRWRILAFFVELPIIRQIANILYRYFARWRFKRLEHCQLAEKQEKEL